MVSGSRPIDKALFAAGLQCPKQLYLDYHDSGAALELSTGRKRLAELGIKLTELAHEAFPKSETADRDDIDTAVEQTRTWLQENEHVAVFDAAFAVDDLEVRADIAIPDGSGGIEIYEVKSGTKVKPRHIRDLAFQVYAIERSGFEVRRAWVLHLNTQYSHRGGNRYPVLELFKHVDVTDKVRGQTGKIGDQLANLRNHLNDPETREQPTGTWCHIPFPCSYQLACREQGPELPLLDLPELNREQETGLLEAGIENLGAVSVDQDGLSSMQQRAVRAIQSREMVIDAFVGSELRDVEFPLHFVDATSLLLVLPVLESSRPWQHVPFQWHTTTVDEDGNATNSSFVGDGKTDPRPEFINQLGQTVAGEGTMMLYGPSLEHRLRELLDDLPDQKADVRSVLNQARFDLRQLVKDGVYHPEFHTSFGLVSVHQALVNDSDFGDGEVLTHDDAQEACQRLMNSRTRAATRDKLIAQLNDYGQAWSGAIARLYRALIDATEDAEVAG